MISKLQNWKFWICHFLSYRRLQVRPRLVTLAAWGIALDQRPRTLPQCIAFCSTRPQSTSVTSLKTFPADVIYSQPLDITWPYHITGSALSVIGPSLSLVRRSGTHYRTVYVTWHSPATASDNRWKRTYFVSTTKHTQCSRDASWLCSLNLLLTLRLTSYRNLQEPAQHIFCGQFYIDSTLPTNWQCSHPWSQLETSEIGCKISSRANVIGFHIVNF